MSKFSEQLDSLIQARVDKGRATIYSLSRNSGIDRSTLYKFRSGERLPPNEATLQRLLEALRLSPIQMEELRSAYAIARMGENRYLCRRNIVEFLNFFGQRETAHAVEEPPAPDGAVPWVLPAGARVYTGHMAVDSLVQKVIGAEVVRTHGELRLIAQPEYEFLVHTLSSLTLRRPCEVYHLLCLESEAPEEDNRYNLGCLRTAVELILSQCTYHPYFYYDSVTSHFQNSALLPYLVLTSTCAVQISYDRQYAVCLGGAEYVAFFRKVFDSACKRARPMMSNLKSAPESVDFYSRIQENHGVLRNCCGFEPCLSILMDRGMMKQYVLDFPNREALIDAFNGYVERQCNCLSKKPVVNYFTPEGLDAFCKTGHIWSVPHNACAPLAPADRCKILQRCCEGEKPVLHIRLLRPARFSVPHGLEIIDFGDNHIAFIYARNPDDYAVIFLHEQSLSACFADFFTYIEEGGLAYSEEESLEIVRQKLEELQSTL